MDEGIEKEKKKQEKIDKDAEDREAVRLKNQHKLENMQSKKYIKNMSKQCPKCNAHIMKVSG